MSGERAKEFLDRNGVRYVTIKHSPAFTAQEIAASAHIPGKEMAKTVIVKIDGEMAMAVVPASFKVDLDMLQDLLQVKNVELATEREFEDLFPECEVGAMPPFDNLYGLETFVSEALAEDAEIVFNAGSHTELIRMAYEEFERLVDPEVTTLMAS